MKHYLQSIIRYNYFNKPKTGGLCGGFLDTITTEHTNKPTLCHIMDFSENSLLFAVPIPPNKIYYTTGQTLRGTLDFGIPATVPFQSIYLTTDTDHDWNFLKPLEANIRQNNYFNNCAKTKFYK